jgi:hypothetical protein
MNTVLESRIARVARARGITFFEAAGVVGKLGAARLRAKRFGVARAARELTRLQSTWHWRRDFE